MEISGTAALVTGGASGLGAATAKRLADAGATVFGLDLAQSIERAGDSVPEGVTLIAADVTSEEEVEAALDKIAEAGVPLRIVVNQKGSARPRTLPHGHHHQPARHVQRHAPGGQPHAVAGNRR